MTSSKRRVAVLAGDTAALVVVDLLIARMKHRAMAVETPAKVARHPWLLAIAVEVAAQIGDAVIYQRGRAAAAIDRAVAAQGLPPAAGRAAPLARSATPLPSPRPVTHEQQLPQSPSSPEA